jgi:hypothetical protein
MALYNFKNPALGSVGAKEFSFEIPDEGQIFKTDQDNLGNLSVIQGGQLKTFDPYQYYVQSKFGGNTDEFYKWVNQSGFRTNQALTNKIYSDLGIDVSKIPYYNPADLRTYAQTSGKLGIDNRSGMVQSTALDYNTAKTLIGQIGNYAAPTGYMGEKDLSAAEAPKVISGEGGPKDAQGNLIPPEDYAKYGITDTKSAAPVTYVNGVAQTAGQVTAQTTDDSEFQRYIKDQGFTDPKVIEQYRQQWADMGPPPGYGQTGENAQRYQILDVASMGKYKPTDYERLPSGEVVLKAGVQPIAGTVKPYDGTTTGTTGTTGATGTTGGQGLASVSSEMKDYTILPDEIKNASWYAGLTDEQKQILSLSYNTITSADEATKQANQQALNEAISLADPYFKSQLLVAQDSIQRGLASTQADVSSQVGTLQTNINNLKEDLLYNREQLTLDQQQQLAQLMNQYQQQLSSLQTGFAESGLAFSSPRQEAEKRLAQQQGDVAESINRRTKQSLRELETGTMRNIQGATQNIADITRRGGEATIEAIRQGEQQLGTAGVLPIAKTVGVGTLGTANAPVTGALDAQKQNAILGLEQTLKEQQNPLTF